MAAIFLLLIPFASAAGGSFGGGTGTLADPFIVEDPLDLNAVRDNLDANYLVNQNIDMGFSDFNTGAGFTPIPSNFNGNFDGASFTISSLLINLPAGTDVGLFSIVSSIGSLDNVILSDINVIGATRIGGLAGTLSGATVTNSSVSGIITGNTMNIGGLVGSSSGVINTSSTSGTITPIDNTTNVGGLVGNNSGNIFQSSSSMTVGLDFIGVTSVGGLIGTMGGGTVDESFAVGNVGGTGSAGGFIGSHVTGTINNSYATGNVDDDGLGQGGFAGNNAASISNSYATGNVDGDGGTNAGGFIGINSGPISGVFSTGTVTSGSNIGGLVGDNSVGGSITNSAWDETNSGIIVMCGVETGTGCNDLNGVTGDPTFFFGGFNVNPPIDTWSTSIWGKSTGVPTFPLLLWEGGVISFSSTIPTPVLSSAAVSLLGILQLIMAALILISILAPIIILKSGRFETSMIMPLVMGAIIMLVAIIIVGVLLGVTT